MGMASDDGVANTPFISNSPLNSASLRCMLRNTSAPDTAAGEPAPPPPSSFPPPLPASRPSLEEEEEEKVLSGE